MSLNIEQHRRLIEKLEHSEKLVKKLQDSN